MQRLFIVVSRHLDRVYKDETESEAKNKDTGKEMVKCIVTGENGTCQIKKNLIRIRLRKRRGYVSVLREERYAIQKIKTANSA